MNKNYLVNSIMKDKVWTDEELAESAMNPIDLSLYDHSEPDLNEARALYNEAMRLRAIGAATYDNMFRGNEDEPEIKTKYFKTYADYFMAQEKVRRQIEFKHEPVDLELEKLLVAETKNIRQQRVEFYRNKKRDHK